jgi:hypothetical protein
MNEFDDRGRAQERKFELDQELEFKAQARRARLVGRWAAQHMGLSAEEADAYSKTVVLADLEEAGEEDLFRKIRADLDASGAAVSDHQLRTHMAELLLEARAQVQAGT